MLFPAQSIGVDQSSLHPSGQLSYDGTKSRRLEAKVAGCCRISIKCGCPGFSQRYPLVDNGRLVGVIVRRDVLRALAEYYPA
jgi:CBS domain-containing protein